MAIQDAKPGLWQRDIKESTEDWSQSGTPRGVCGVEAKLDKTGQASGLGGAEVRVLYVAIALWATIHHDTLMFVSRTY